MENNKSKEAYYFSHDSNARNDTKLLRVRLELGIEGYGIYFCLIEILKDTKDYKVLLDLDMLEYDIRADKSKIEKVINDYGLFIVEDDIFYSKSLLNRMILKEEVCKKRAEAGRKGGLSKGEANDKQNQSIKRKKRKEKKLTKTTNEVKRIYGEFVYLTDEQHKKLIDKFGEQGTKDRIENLNDGIGSKGYKYDSHYHTILTWERNNKFKKPPETMQKSTHNENPMSRKKRQVDTKEVKAITDEMNKNIRDKPEGWILANKKLQKKADDMRKNVNSKSLSEVLKE